MKSSPSIFRGCSVMLHQVISKYLEQVKLQVRNKIIRTKCFHLAISLVQGFIHIFKSLLENSSTSFLNPVICLSYASRFLSRDSFSYLGLLLRFQKWFKLNNPGSKRGKGSMDFCLFLKRLWTTILLSKGKHFLFKLGSLIFNHLIYPLPGIPFLGRTAHS